MGDRESSACGEMSHLDGFAFERCPENQVSEQESSHCFRRVERARNDSQ